MDEHLVGIIHRTRGNRRNWIMILGKVSGTSSQVVSARSKISSESENPWIICLEWPYNFTWRIFIVITTYICILVTIMMLINLADMTILIAIQNVCTIFFLIDFFLAVLHRIVYLPAKIFLCKRSIKCLIIEAISILPLSTCYMIAVRDYNSESVFWFSSVIFLRFYRIPQFFSEESCSAGIAHIKFTILKFTLYLFLSLFTCSALWMQSTHERKINIKHWDLDEAHKFFVAFYFSSMTFTNTGFGDVFAISIYEKIICIAAMLVGFTLITGVLIGSLTKDLLQREKPRENYRRECNETVNYMKGRKLTHSGQKKIAQEMNMLWHYKRGVTDYSIVNLLPIPLRKEIYFDLVFGFLYRSIVFSNQERSFLRSISMIMKNKTYLPGDEIIKPTGIFRGMICITSGVVEMLSRENEDSPIISFTSGTILGEISLFMALPIKTIIRASTIVELQVLDTIDFYRLAMKYKTFYASMRGNILHRCKQSQKIVLNDDPRSLDPEEPVNLRQKALKFLIQNLKGQQPQKEETTTTDAFKATILNLYVLVENLPRVKTLPINLIRSRPWILRPDTTLTNLWDIFMFLVVTVVIFYYPYMAAFAREVDSTDFVVLFFVEIVYLCDVLKQCITAVPRDDLYSYKTEIKEIVLTRLRSYGFYLDVISTYEFGVFAPMFDFGSRDHILLLLSLNKLLRLWIIPRFFSKMEDQLSVSLLFIRILKYIYYLTWLMHFSAMILYLEACPRQCYPDRWFGNLQSMQVLQKKDDPGLNHPYVMSLYLALMLTSTTGYGNIRPASIIDIAVMLLIMTMGLIALSYVLSELSVTFKHRERRRTELQEEIYAIDRFLVEHNLPQNLRRRMRRYFRVQWEYDKGSSFQRNMEVEQLPRKLRQITLNEKLMILKSVPIFKDANPGFMLVLAKGSKVRVLPDDEMIVYAGSLDREMYILHSGYCEIHDRTAPGLVSVIGPYTSFGDLEMVQGVPIIIDVKTLTHVRLICIEYSTYMRAVTKYPDVRRDIENLMETTKLKTSRSLIHLPMIRLTESHNQALTRLEWLKHLWNKISNSVINVYKHDKMQNQNYWEPFQNWSNLRFLRYLFVPVVIKPNSALLSIWMSIRILASFVVGFFAPVYFTLPKMMHKVTGLIFFVQTITWVDIYVTLHLAYYDRTGVLVFHPSKTAVHYIKGSFFLDLFISFPYFWMVDRFTTRKEPNIIYNGPGLIKVLQYYKVLQACNFYETDILKRSATLKLLKYLPTILIVTNLLAGLLILIECQAISKDEVIPNDNSTLSIYRQNLKKHCISGMSETSEGNIDMYLIAYYYITASMTSCGFGDVVATNTTTFVVCIFTVMLGVFLYGSMFASIASSKIFAYHNVTKYRTEMKEMMKFLDKGNVNETLKRRFFTHYMHNWIRTYGYAPQKTLSDIHTVLKQDIVDWMYESTLRKVSVFSYVDKSFIRCIGKYIDEIYFLEGETICKHNHIQEDIYIIYRGKINVLDADGNHVTNMGDGGLFGNLTDKPSALSVITAIAVTNVELLRLRTEDFHKALANYPEIKLQISRLTKQSKDYIIPFSQTVSVSLDEFDTDIPEEEQTANRFPDIHARYESDYPDSRKRKGNFFLARAIYKPAGKSRFNFLIVSGSWLHSLIAILTVIFSYISCISILYVFAFQDYQLAALFVYFFPDIFFYIKIALEFNYTYIDRRGDHIYIRKIIRRRYMSDRRFYFDIFSNIPLEVFAIFVPSSSSLYVMSFLRLNRLLRFYYIIEYYKSQTNKLMVNIFLLEIGTLLAWTSIMIHFFVCIWYMAACPIFFCYETSWITHIGMQNAGKLELYITSIYYVVTLITTTGYGDIVSVTRLEIVISTLSMILSHFGMVLGAVTFLAMINVHSLTFVRYEECISQFRKDLIRQKISKYQLKKLWRYVQLLWWRELGKQVPQFIHSAPYIMKCDVYSAMYGEHFNRSYIFTDLDETFLQQLAIYMKRYIFFPGYYIVQQGDNDGTMYFIHRGEVSVMTIHIDLMETIHYHLKTNDQFGISQGLIFGQPHVFSYRAETEVEIISLTLEHWQHLFKHFPKIKPIIYERLNKL